MESEIEHTYISSDFFDKKQFQEQIDVIKKASEVAQSKVDFVSAHDDNIIRAIEVVEEFLRKTHRLCYGGQAINAHLPAKYKFYDPKTSIPDYDFFTPQQHHDVIHLVKDLRKAGFSEISARDGMHEGTIKIYVDYIPVADMTAIDPRLYRILSNREFRTDGISYLDANSLRMLMYLELSRPRGEVTRWTKVYERLALLNEFVPVKSCKMEDNPFHGAMTQEQSKFVLHFLIQHKRVFAGADLLEFYEHSLTSKHKNTTWMLRGNKPIVFFSNHSETDAKQIRNEFSILRSFHASQNGASPVPFTIRSYSSKGVDLIPSMKIICQGKKSLVFVIDQTACHSYFNIPVNDGKILRIASMDTLITLYFSLGLIDSTYFDMGSMVCLANQLVEISIKARSHPDDFAFPFISIQCVGHQTTLPSLIRSKVKRLMSRKEELRDLLNVAMTDSIKNNKVKATGKNKNKSKSKSKSKSKNKNKTKSKTKTIPKNRLRTVKYAKRSLN